MDPTLVMVVTVTIFTAHLTHALARETGDAKDYYMAFLQVILATAVVLHLLEIV